MRSLSLFEGEGQGEGALEPGAHVSAGISDRLSLRSNSKVGTLTKLPLPDPLPRGGRGNVFDMPLLYLKLR